MALHFGSPPDLSSDNTQDNAVKRDGLTKAPVTFVGVVINEFAERNIPEQIRASLVHTSSRAWRPQLCVGDSCAQLCVFSLYFAIRVGIIMKRIVFGIEMQYFNDKCKSFSKI